MLIDCKAKFAILLLRKHKIVETLSLVLLSWTPETVSQAWKVSDDFPKFPVSSFFSAR
jgi:hypothetical protein